MAKVSYLLVAAILLFLTSVQAREMVIQSSQPGPHLLELFSSEGCSSCPPAEAWMSRLKEDPQLWHRYVPVEFHVDYWDNLGWPDRFARGKYTERQRQYAAHWGTDSVYTPCFVLEGQEWRDWEGEIPEVPVKNLGGQITLMVRGNEVTAHFREEQKLSASPILNLAWLGFNLRSDVQRGENGGRTLRHDFIALDFQSIPLLLSADGTYAGPALLPHLSGPDQPGAVAAWITTPEGALLQVVGGWLP